MAHPNTLPTAPIEEVYSSLFDPFKEEGPQVIVRLRSFDAYMDRTRKQTYDPLEARRAHDWSLLSHQIVGHESFARKRR